MRRKTREEDAGLVYAGRGMQYRGQRLDRSNGRRSTYTTGVGGGRHVSG